MQFLATQVADEARHVEVFTRRAPLCRPGRWASRARRTSLAADAARRAGLAHRLVPAVCPRRRDVPLPAVLPRPLRTRSGHRRRSPASPFRTRPATSRSPSGHLGEHASSDPQTARPAAGRRRAPPRRPGPTAGLAPPVHDALVIVASGSWETDAIATGWERVRELEAEMDEGRQRRLMSLGFLRPRGGRALRPAQPQLHVAVHPRHPSCRKADC